MSTNDYGKLPNMAERARRFAAMFDHGTRDDGTEYYFLRDEAPDWASSLVQTIHGGMFPDDWLYQAAYVCAQHIADTGDYEYSPEADVYTRDLIRWLADDPEAQEYCDQYLSEYMADRSAYGGSLFEILQGGQYERLRAITQQIGEALEDDDLWETVEAA